MSIRYKMIIEDLKTSVRATNDLAHTYNKGRTITAHENTIGLLVFKNKKSAEEWLDNLYDKKLVRIIKVDCKGRGKRVRTVLGMGSLFMYDHEKIALKINRDGKISLENLGWHDLTIIKAPKGTIAYRELTVLE